MKRTLASLTILLSLAFGALLAQDKGGKGGGKGGPGLTLSSPDFEDGGIIPDKYTQKGGPSSPSPKLEWKNVPPGTQSFALLMHDPDVALAKKLDDVTHWLIFNIPGTATELQGGVPAEPKLADGTINAKGIRQVGYMGPGAPAAGPYHHYTFELFALDTKLDLGPDASRADVMKAIDGHILGKGVLEGRFHQ